MAFVLVMSAAGVSLGLLALLLAVFSAFGFVPLA
jgi:hypothetical protein